MGMLDSQRTASFGTPLVGERGDAFLVTICLTSKQAEGVYQGRKFIRTGYRTMWNALSGFRMTKGCNHAQVDTDRVRLGIGWCALGYVDLTNEIQGFRYKLLFVAGGHAMRWLAVLEVLHSEQNAMLRTSNCCVDCAIKQTESQDGEWYLIW